MLVPLRVLALEDFKLMMRVLPKAASTMDDFDEWSTESCEYGQTVVLKVVGDILNL